VLRRPFVYFSVLFATLTCAQPALAQAEDSNLPFKITMGSLSASALAMQAFDVDSTIRSKTRGGVETNPLMAPLSDNRMAFLAVKTGGMAAVLYATHRLAKHNKLAAVATLVAVNASYVFIVRNNYAIARR